MQYTDCYTARELNQQCRMSPSTLTKQRDRYYLITDLTHRLQKLLSLKHE